MDQAIVTLLITLAGTAVAMLIITTIVGLRNYKDRVICMCTMFVGLFATMAALYLNGIRVNCTPSMPLGVYRFVSMPSGGVRRGMILAVCAPLPVADFGRRRGYLHTGVCPHSVEPLLKTVAAIGGDTVDISGIGVCVNGRLLPQSRALANDRAGHLLLPWPRGVYRLRSNEIWLYSDQPRSWDSRYWGPAKLQNIQARMVPLLTLGAPEVNHISMKVTSHG